MLSVFFFGWFLKDSPKLVPVQAGSTRKTRFFPGVLCFLFVTSVFCYCFALISGLRSSFFPRKTSFFCRPCPFRGFLCDILRSDFCLLCVL